MSATSEVRGGIEKHDQVDVAGIVQLARAHLAHGEHDQAGALLRPVLIDGGHAAARDLLAQQEAQAPSARSLPPDRSAPPSPASPARPRRCRTARSTARPPTSCGEAAASRRLSPAAASTSREVFSISAREMRFGVACQQTDQPRGVGADQIEQIGRELGDAEQNGPGERAIQPRADRSRLLAAPVRRASLSGVVRHCWQQRYAAR